MTGAETPAERLRVIVADDHPVVASGLQQLLEEWYDVVATVPDGEELVEAAAAAVPDVVMTDLSMPGVGGLEAVRTIAGRDRGIKIIVFTMHDEPAIAAEAFEAGARGFLLKDAPPEEIHRAIEAVRVGERYLSEGVQGAIRASLAPPSGGPLVHLTRRQREVLELTARGASMKKIAAQLRISRRTAESHKQRLMKTLNVHSTAELVQCAIAAGLIPALGPAAAIPRPKDPPSSRARSTGSGKAP